MANDLLSLAGEMESLRSKIDVAASKTAVDVSLAIVGDLAYKTPVDTSKALSNWLVTLDAPADQRIEPHYPGNFGSTFRTSAAETINIAKMILRGKKPGQAIFITNNLPYIKKLNDGSSTQAPAGFVERAILIGRKVIEKFKIKD